MPVLRVDDGFIEYETFGLYERPFLLALKVGQCDEIANQLPFGFLTLRWYGRDVTAILPHVENIVCVKALGLNLVEVTRRHLVTFNVRPAYLAKTLLRLDETVYAFKAQPKRFTYVLTAYDETVFPIGSRLVTHGFLPIVILSHNSNSPYQLLPGCKRAFASCSHGDCSQSHIAC